MKQISLRAMAKINLSLDVTGEREDGYHDLRMVMQSVRLCDQVTIRATQTPGIRIRTNLHFLPDDKRNLAARAAQLLMDECGVRQGVFINLEKHIPVAAGLAGGSSDAAAVLVGMNILFGLGKTGKELRDLGVRLGADVPFCIMRGTALAEGIGEVLTPLPGLPDCRILIAKPDIHVSTKEVFGALKLTEQTVHPDTDAQAAAVREGDLQRISSLCGNVLETVTAARYPAVDAIRHSMLEDGALTAVMSGSGPSVFGIFDSRKAAEKALISLQKGKEAGFVCLTRPYNRKEEGNR